MDKKEQRLAASIFGVLFVIVLIVLAIAFPKPTPFQYLVFRVVLALAAAGVVAMIPGFIDLQFPGWIRAGGALAVFLIGFFYNPAALVVEKPDGEQGGADSGHQAEKLVQELRGHIIALRGAYEGLPDSAPELAANILSEAPKAAKRLEGISDERLDEGFVVVKYGYAGLAYLLGGLVSSNVAEAGTYSQKSATDLRYAIGLIGKIRYQANGGDAYSEALVKWIDDDDIESWARYDLAVALCRQAQVGSKRDLSEALLTLGMCLLCICTTFLFSIIRLCPGLVRMTKTLAYFARSTSGESLCVHHFDFFCGYERFICDCS